MPPNLPRNSRFVRGKSFNEIGRAFTLIELLVTIAICGFLAALIYPSYKGALEKSRASSCSSNLRQLGTAAILYLNDHDGELPLNIDASLNTWPVALSTYLNVPLNTNIGQRPSGPFSCPVSKNLTAGGNFSDFGKNALISGSTAAPHGPWKLSAVTRPSQIIAFADSEVTPGKCNRDLGPWTAPTSAIVGRHQGKANILFFDWHVEAIDPTKIPSGSSAQYYPPWQP